MTDQELEPSVELEHLRRLLDTQPGCLMRLGADGTVLAANDAALSLLGVPSRAQALGRDFAAWVAPDGRDAWRAFTAGVLEGGRASIECDVEPAPDERRAALFHATPLLDHPDGVSSMLVSARAVGGQRQVEAAIVELEEQLRDRDAEREAARGRLAEAEEERRAAAEALAASESARKAAEAEWAAARAEVRQLEMALESFASKRQRAVAAGAELEEARSERARLEAALREAEGEIARLRERETEASADRDRLLAAIVRQAGELQALATGAAATPGEAGRHAGDASGPTAEASEAEARVAAAGREEATA